MEQLSPQARAMLDRALDVYDPPATAKSQVRAGLAAAIATPGPAVLEAERGLGGGGGVAGALAGLGLAGAALTLTLGVSSLWSPDRTVQSSQGDTVASAASSFTQVRYTEPSSRRPAAEKRRSSSVPRRSRDSSQAGRPVPAAGAAAPVEVVSSLAEEARILGEARGALRDGQPELALELVDEHARRFPAGALRMERFAAEALAACDVGDGSRTSAAAAELRRLDPSSPHLKRIEHCR